MRNLTKRKEALHYRPPLQMEIVRQVIRFRGNWKQKVHRFGEEIQPPKKKKNKSVSYKRSRGVWFAKTFSIFNLLRFRTLDWFYLFSFSIYCLDHHKLLHLSADHSLDIGPQLRGVLRHHHVLPDVTHHRLEPPLTSEKSSGTSLMIAINVTYMTWVNGANVVSDVIAYDSKVNDENR